VLHSLILLIYHAVSGFERTGMFYCISELIQLKQHLVDVWQSATELTQPSISGESNREHSCVQIDSTSAAYEIELEDLLDAASSSRNTSAHVVPSIESLCQKTGKQIAGWVRMSSNHVFRGGLKCTILSLSGEGIRNLDWRYLGPFRSSALANWKIDQKLTEMGGFRAPKL